MTTATLLAEEERSIIAKNVIATAQCHLGNEVQKYYLMCDTVKQLKGYDGLQIQPIFKDYQSKWIVTLGNHFLQSYKK